MILDNSAEYFSGKAVVTWLFPFLPHTKLTAFQDGAGLLKLTAGK